MQRLQKSQVAKSNAIKLEQGPTTSLKSGCSRQHSPSTNFAASLTTLQLTGHAGPRQYRRPPSLASGRVSTESGTVPAFRRLEV
jgi:hypothetical protein